MKAHLRALFVVLGVVLLGGVIAALILRARPEARPEAQRAVDVLPALQMKTITGEAVDTAKLKGHVVIINFWASWCGPCIEEVPSLINLSKAIGSDLEILAVSGDSTVEDINVFLKSFPDFRRPGISIIYDEGMALAKAFDVQRLPESFIFDANGKVVRKVTGSIDWSTQDALSYIKHQH